jgi:hypothetical protein
MSTKIILKKLKEMGTIWHPESTLVFKSKDDKVVTGRWDGTEFIELDDVAIESCEKWGFKIDESLVNEEEEEQEEEEEKVEEEEEHEEKVEEVQEEEEVVPLPEVSPPSDNTTFEIIRAQIQILGEKMEKSNSMLVDTRLELVESKTKLASALGELESLKIKFGSLKSLLA